MNGDRGSGIGDQAHETSVAIWDLTSPVIVGRRAVFKVGVACRSACNLTGAAVDVYNEAGTRAGGGTLGPSPWPGTAALYWTELEIDAPNAEGDQAWSIRATTAEPTHREATAVVRFAACAPPEHAVTVRVFEKSSGAPIAAVDLRLGRFRAATNTAGVASVELPAGTYEVGTWKNGYELTSKTVVVAADTTIDLELTVAREPDQPYWM
jgi:hypothetical protein